MPPVPPDVWKRLLRSGQGSDGSVTAWRLSEGVVLRGDALESEALPPAPFMIGASPEQASHVTASLHCGQQLNSFGRRISGFPSCRQIFAVHPLSLPSPLSPRPCLLSMLLPPPMPGMGSGALRRAVSAKPLGCGAVLGGSGWGAFPQRRAHGRAGQVTRISQGRSPLCSAGTDGLRSRVPTACKILAEHEVSKTF